MKRSRTFRGADPGHRLVYTVAPSLMYAEAFDVSLTAINLNSQRTWRVSKIVHDVEAFGHPWPEVERAERRRLFKLMREALKGANRCL